MKMFSAIKFIIYQILSGRLGRWIIWRRSDFLEFFNYCIHGLNFCTVDIFELFHVFSLLFMGETFYIRLQGQFVPTF